MSCTKISRQRQLNAWRMELTTVQETFSCKTIFFKIDQLIADNPKSSKQTFKGAVSDFAKSPSLIFLLAKSRVLLLS